MTDEVKALIMQGKIQTEMVLNNYLKTHMEEYKLSENQIKMFEIFTYNRALNDVNNIITEQLDKSDNQVECQTLRWVLDVLLDLIK